MRKYFLLVVAIVLFTVNYGKSQDVIVKKDNTSMKVKVLEITDEEVKYKKFDNSDSPIYSVKKAEIVNIVYQNGDVDFFDNLKTESNKDCEIDLPQCGLRVACADVNTEITWEQANAKAPEGWRLPTLKELYCMCQYQEILYMSDQDEYWSSTTKGNKAYSVTFNDCAKEKNSKNRTKAVRYVK